MKNPKPIETWIYEELEIAERLLEESSKIYREEIEKTKIAHLSKTIPGHMTFAS